MITGKFAITDYFDNNSYSHDPRRQFMNWPLMSNGAWDYPADTRGYTIGTMQELTMRGWSLRSATVMEPTEANGPTFDTRVAKNRGAEGHLTRRPFWRHGEADRLAALADPIEGGGGHCPTGLFSGQANARERQDEKNSSSGGRVGVESIVPRT